MADIANYIDKQLQHLNSISTPGTFDARINSIVLTGPITRKNLLLINDLGDDPASMYISGYLSTTNTNDLQVGVSGSVSSNAYATTGSTTLGIECTVDGSVIYSDSAFLSVANSTTELPNRDKRSYIIDLTYPGTGNLLYELTISKTVTGDGSGSYIFYPELAVFQVG